MQPGRDARERHGENQRASGRRDVVWLRERRLPGAETPDQSDSPLFRCKPCGAFVSIVACAAAASTILFAAGARRRRLLVLAADSHHVFVDSQTLVGWVRG